MGLLSMETDDLGLGDDGWAVLWEFNGKNDNGTIKVKSPIEIPVRWVEVIRNPQGPTDEALVYDVVMPCDRDIPDGSILWHGKLEELPADETSIPDLYKSISRDVTPDVKGINTRYTSHLQRYGDTLPTVNNS